MHFRPPLEEVKSGPAQNIRPRLYLHLASFTSDPINQKASCTLKSVNRAKNAKYRIRFHRGVYPLIMQHSAAGYLEV